MNHETEESRMKRMRKADVEELKRATSPWINYHFGREEMLELEDASDEVFAQAPKEGVKALGFSFCQDIPKCIEWAKKHSGLEGLKINDCYYGEEGGMKVYGELGALTNLRYLLIRASKFLDRETLRLIAGLPRLEGLVLALQRIDSARNLRELAACRSLRALCIWVEDLAEEDGPWVEDLQFLSELPLLENLDLEACERIDLSKFTLPPALKVFTVPNYTAAEVKRKFREKCAVIKGGCIHRPCRYRFLRERPPKVPKPVHISKEPLGGLFAGMEDETTSGECGGRDGEN